MDPTNHNDAGSGTPLGLSEYQPEKWTVYKDDVYAAIDALDAGIEFSRELLADHHERLGRTTAKNRWWAEVLERGIEKMEKSRERLRCYSEHAMPKPNAEEKS